MHMISYVSDSTINQNNIKNEIGNLVSTAHQNNKQLGLTGVLFYENDHFFQTIEGKESNLRKIYTAIEKDNRHNRIIKLIDEPIRARTFNDWSLETFYVDNPDLINPQTLKLLRELYIQNFGVSATGLIEFVKKMIDEMDTFKIMKTPYTNPQ